MSSMHRHIPTPPLATARAILLAAAMLLVPGGLHGQSTDTVQIGAEPTDTPPTRRPGASVDASLAVQRLGGGTLVGLGGRLWLHFPAGWRLGVGGLRGLDRIDGGELESSGLEAHFGMAGVTVAVPLPVIRGVSGLEGMLTVGSGAVSLDNALVGTTVDTETAWIVHPSILWPGREFGPLRIGAEVGYRWMLDTEGLSRLDASDLRTFTLAGIVSFPTG